MKTAEYEVKMKRGDVQFTRYGKVTLKEDGKISFSIPFSRDYSYASNELVKKVGREIVAANFKHPAITSLQIDDDPTSLVALLTENTQDVRAEFMEATRIHSESYWYEQTVLNQRTKQEWLDAYGVTENFMGEKYTSGSRLIGKTAEYKEYLDVVNVMKSAMAQASAVSALTQEDYVARQVKLADQHYKHSIEKLAFRLNKKGITTENLKQITHGKVGQNFECYIYHDDKLTIAYTIIASGPVQRPHYRYLLK